MPDEEKKKKRHFGGDWKISVGARILALVQYLSVARASRAVASWSQFPGGPLSSSPPLIVM